MGIKWLRRSLRLNAYRKPVALARHANPDSTILNSDICNRHNARSNPKLKAICRSEHNFRGGFFLQAPVQWRWRGMRQTGPESEGAWGTWAQRQGNPKAVRGGGSVHPLCRLIPLPLLALPLFALAVRAAFPFSRSAASCSRLLA
jgi:hypothetical protein